MSPSTIGLSSSIRPFVMTLAEIVGEARARSYPPQLPLECREHMRRVVPKIGDKFRGTQLRWETSADQVDAQIDRCAQFHDDWAEKASK